MIWTVFIGVALMVMAVLTVLSGHDVGTIDGQFFGSEVTQGLGFYTMSALLLGCAFLCFKFNQFYPKSLLGKSALWATNSLVFIIMLLLFVLRAISTEQAFDKTANLIPKHGYTITAKVTVLEISDGIYAEGMHYRQKAVLSELAFGDLMAAETAAQTNIQAANPFAITTDEPKRQLPLPEEMTVLLQTANLSDKDKKDKTNFNKLSKLEPNTTAQMTLWITPITADPSATGFDGERWLRTRHIHANAKVLSIHGDVMPITNKGLLGYLEQFRQKLRAHFYQDWQALSSDKRQAKAVTLALLTGDRALIDRTTKETYQFGGISHLLAISGTHVVFLAMMLAHALCFLTDRFLPIYHRLPRHHLRSVIMIGASLIYALFTGFDVPAVRTVYMMMAVAVASYLALPLSPLMVLMCVGLAMIWLDPVMVWQAGFWLSFVAVALLMSYGEREFDAANKDIKDRLVGLLKLQTHLFIAMLPISLLLFGKVSLWGLIINLFAVGLFGAVVVPINLLAGVLFVVLPSLSDMLWAISTFILDWLDDLLVVLQGMGGVWLYQTTSIVAMALLGIGIVLLMHPVMGRKFALVPLVAFVMMSHGDETPFSVTVLDSDDDKVSQVLIHQYNANDGDDAVWLFMSDFQTDKSIGHESMTKVLLDKLHQQNIRYLTGIIVQTPSHRMANMVNTIKQEIPIHHYWQAGQHIEQVGMPVQPCKAGQMWAGQGLNISALTGWQMIDDERVWGCTILVESEFTPTIDGGLHHEYQKVDESNTKIGSRLLFNGASHDHTWQMYALMCHEQEVYADVWLGHTRHAINSNMVEQMMPYSLIFTDKDTAENKERVELAVATLTP